MLQEKLCLAYWWQIRGLTFACKMSWRVRPQLSSFEHLIPLLTHLHLPAMQDLMVGVIALLAAPTQSALKCGDYYTTSDGTYYQVQCGFDWPGHDIQHVPYSNLSSCIDAYSDYGSQCKGVIWVSAVKMHKTVGSRVPSRTRLAFLLVSAFSLLPPYNALQWHHALALMVLHLSTPRTKSTRLLATPICKVMIWAV